MTTTTIALLIAAGVAAIIDWIAVAGQRERLIYIFKPAVMVALILATITLPDIPTTLRLFVIGAQLAGLTGDVALMLGKFIPGAAAFAVGHVLYIIGWLPYAVPGIGAAVGIVLALVLMFTFGRRITVAAAHRSIAMGQVVSIYQVLLSLMAVAAFATDTWLLAAAAALFVVSDTILGWTRFVHERPQLRVVVHMTYHIAQIGIVAALPLLVSAS
ncbi:MAG: lysoplasmalogenase [Actinobacteria bacterium]|nr:lysoplasmalogenase [Actinomycetota bacterium]MCB9413272.1 lysoplasmalogenase [Actinomycetota bacterium]